MIFEKWDPFLYDAECLEVFFFDFDICFKSKLSLGHGLRLGESNDYS